MLEGRFEIVERHEDNTVAVMDYYEQVKVEVALQPGEGRRRHHGRILQARQER